MRRTTRGWGVGRSAAGLVVALGLAACSGSDGSADPTTPVAATTADTTPASTSGGTIAATAPSATAAAPTSGSTTGPSSTSGTSKAAAPADLAPPAGVTFPVGVSENKRYLIDQDGKPYMLNGDSPQCMSANLSTADMELFFEDRQQHGFNAAWVNLICGPYTHGREDASTYDGIRPFTDSHDLSTVNLEYWRRMDTMVDLAKKYGITLVLDPAETGSFSDLLKDNGEVKSEAYGTFLGERYRDDVNIIWMFGNDYSDWERYDPYLVALSKGLRAADPEKLQTIELNPSNTSFDDPVWPPLIDLASAYAYSPTYEVVLRAYNAAPTTPVFMVEANYEFENNDNGPPTSDETMRRQEYWTMLSGATGQLYGNKYTWGFEDEVWKQHFDTKAVEEWQLMVRLFSARSWQDLVPDEQHRFLTDGVGEPTNQGDVLESDYATAATTRDGSLGIVYVPTARTITVDVRTLQPGMTARWFDPTDGSFRDARAPFTTPGKNAAGAGDWVLVIEPPR
jgi:Protein of unknown function (DUF4038)/Putative collagen-binding domain of a collagenase